MPASLTTTASSPEISIEGFVALAVAAIVAIAAPPLLAYNLAPSATFLNQAVAFIGWAILLIVLIAVMPRTSANEATTGRLDFGAPSFFLAMGLLVIAAIGSLMAGSTTSSLMLSTVGAMLAAVLCAAIGIVAMRRGVERQVFCAVCIAFVVVGVLSTAVGVIQVFKPDWADANFIAPSSVVGRATGNLRQPNHLCSLMAWAIVALVWLVESGHWRRWIASVLGLMFLFTLVLTASRTAWFYGGVLMIWAVLDGRLTRATRLSLAAACVLYVLMWIGLSEWAKASHHLFYGAERLAAQTDISSSRYGIWRNTASLIQAHPWWGVGWGDFNFAWSLTPFPGRPVAFFDHTHDIVLQFLVELGVPLGTVVTVLLGYALWRVLWAPDEVDGTRRGVMRAGSVMVAMIGIHSMLEYPLWYAYFLLPTAFLVGLGLGQPRSLRRSGASIEVDAAAGVASAATMGDAVSPHAGARVQAHPPLHPRQQSAMSFERLRPWLFAASACMFVASIACVRDYFRVVAIFAPEDDAVPLEQRIEAGRHSWFFAHHADYAAATVAVRPSTAMPSFADASHYLLDTRLMVAWAKAFDEAGQVDKARYLAARLREFHNEDAKPFFEPCDDPESDDGPLPFQCTPPEKAYEYRDFR